MSIDPNDFRAPSEKRIKLKQWATKRGPLYKSTKQYKTRLAEDVAEELEHDFLWRTT